MPSYRTLCMETSVMPDCMKPILRTGLNVLVP